MQQNLEQFYSCIIRNLRKKHVFKNAAQITETSRQIASELCLKQPDYKKKPDVKKKSYIYVKFYKLMTRFFKNIRFQKTYYLTILINDTY